MVARRLSRCLVRCRTSKRSGYSFLFFLVPNLGAVTSQASLFSSLCHNSSPQVSSSPFSVSNPSRSPYRFGLALVFSLCPAIVSPVPSRPSRRPPPSDLSLLKHASPVHPLWPLAQPYFCLSSSSPSSLPVHLLLPFKTSLVSFLVSLSVRLRVASRSGFCGLCCRVVVVVVELVDADVGGAPPRYHKFGGCSERTQAALVWWWCWWLSSCWCRRCGGVFRKVSGPSERHRDEGFARSFVSRSRSSRRLSLPLSSLSRLCSSSTLSLPTSALLYLYAQCYV